MKFQVVKAVLVTFVSFAVTGVAAADPVRDLEECRSVAVELERLACFDAAYDQLSAAGMTPDSILKANVLEIKVLVPVAADPGEKSEAGGKIRKIFGFRIPAFLRRGAEPPQDFGLQRNAAKRNENGGVDRIASRITEVRKSPRDKLIVTLENGQRWRQTQGRRLRAKVGEIVTIRRGVLGGFMMKVGDSLVVRAKRIDDGSSEISEGVVTAVSEASKIVPDPQGDVTSDGGRTPTSDAFTPVNEEVEMLMVDPTNMFLATLGNGQVWQQTGGVLRVRQGDSITIHADGSGGYLLQIKGELDSVPVIRVR